MNKVTVYIRPMSRGHFKQIASSHTVKLCTSTRTVTLLRYQVDVDLLAQAQLVYQFTVYFSLRAATTSFGLTLMTIKRYNK